MFDGSSIAGWKAIHESDMCLMPDPASAVIDPFFADTTLILICDVLEHIQPTPTLYPESHKGLARVLAQWADTTLFWAAMAYNLQPKGAAAMFDGAPPEAAKAFGAGSAVHDEAPDNQCYHWGIGDKAGTEAAFAQAAHVTTLSFRNNRLIPNAMEPRAANAAYNPHEDSYTLYVSNQNPHVERLLMCAFVLGIPEHKLRVVAPDVGGGFGSKIYLYGEETALVWASKQIRRPIKWTCDRSEAFLSDAHGRDHVSLAELALDKDGHFLGLRATTTANIGAYLSTFASCVPTILHATLLAGQYKTPKIWCEVKSVFTNTAPVDAYRGAGRPERGRGGV
jgi:carbon-monoxide dehydrogenase large subunit